MKALSVQQPWAHQILSGVKKFEYRTWKTDYRGDLLICSSASPKVENTISGHALVVVRLDDIVEVTRFNYRSLGLPLPPAYGKKEYAWVLTKRRVVKPFEVKGKLNFFYVDDELIEIIKTSDEIISDEELPGIYGEEMCKKFYKKRASVKKRENEPVHDRHNKARKRIRK